jgi:hypothetical protein
MCRCPLWRVRGARHGKRGARASTDLVVKGRREATDVHRDDTVLLSSPMHTSGTTGPLPSTAWDANVPWTPYWRNGRQAATMRFGSSIGRNFCFTGGTQIVTLREGRKDRAPSSSGATTLIASRSVGAEDRSKQTGQHAGQATRTGSTTGRCGGRW